MPFVGTTFLKAAQLAFVKGGIGKLPNLERKLKSAREFFNCSNGSSLHTGVERPCPWDTHYQFSIKTLLSNLHHYRYYIPYVAVFSLRFLVVLCILRFRFFKLVFSTLQSSSYCQLANSCLLRGYEGFLLRIDILSFFVTEWYIFEVICWVFSTLVRNSLPV